MAKSKRDKKRETVKKKLVIPAPKSETDAPENPWDFGGLPNRDLKKNLGCG